MYLLPILMRNLRISGWKITTSAIVPTSMMVPNSADIIFIFRAFTSILSRSSEIMARNMLMAAEPFIHLKTT